MNPENKTEETNDMPDTPSSAPLNSPPDNPQPVPDDSPPGSPTPPIPTTPPDTPIEPIGPSSTTSTTPPKKRSALRMYMLVVIVVVAFAAAIWAAVQITDKNSPTSGVTKHDVALLRVGSTEPITSGTYPNMQTDAFAEEINTQAFEGLTKFENETQVVPDLATSWTNPTTTTWVFKLRQGVMFHDGNTLTSKQVVASLTQIQKYPVGQSIPYNIKTATAVGPYTVQITTTQPDPILDRELTQFWIWDTDDTKTPNNVINGTGPFELKPDTKKTSSSVQYIAYDNYHGDKPTVKQLDFYYYTSPKQLITGLQQNKIDIADLTNWPEYTSQATKNGDKLFNVLDPLVYYVVPNTLKAGSPLQNLKVRQAIYITINPTLLAKAHNGDVGAPATQLVPPSIPGYNPNIKRPAINPTAAKALLAQAGYPNGFTLSFAYYAPSQDGVATELQKELAAIGIKLTLTPETDGNTFFNMIANGQGDLFTYGDASDIIDTSDVAAATVIDTAEYSNPQVDALFNQAQQTFNSATRLKLLQQLNATVMNDLAIFPIYNPTNQYIAYRPSMNLVLNQQYIGGETGLYYSQIYASK